MTDKDKIMQRVISKMLLIAPENYITLNRMQTLINLYPTKNGIEITYGIIEVSDKSETVYIDNETPTSLSINEQARADVNIDLLNIANMGFEQVMATLKKVGDDYQGRVSYYEHIFTKDRNDPQAELLFWRSQLGYEALNQLEQDKIDSVAKYFKD